MGMSVNKFLCFKLESGGIPIVYYSLCTSIVGIGFSIFLFHYGLSSRSSDNDSSIFEKFLVGLSVAVICVICVIISYKAIYAIKTRNHLRLIPIIRMLQVYAILHFLTFLSFLISKDENATDDNRPPFLRDKNILTYYDYFIIYGLLNGMLYLYMSIVMSSILKLFKQEYQSKSDELSDRSQSIDDTEVEFV